MRSMRRRRTRSLLWISFTALLGAACIEGHSGDTTPPGILAPPAQFPTPSGVSVVTGRVYDQQTGLSLPGARVHISTVESFADSTGWYRLTGISSGFVVLEAQRDGYEARWMQVPLSPGTNSVSIGMRSAFGP